VAAYDGDIRKKTAAKTKNSHFLHITNTPQSLEGTLKLLGKKPCLHPILATLPRAFPAIQNRSCLHESPDTHNPSFARLLINYKCTKIPSGFQRKSPLAIRRSARLFNRLD